MQGRRDFLKYGVASTFAAFAAGPSNARAAVDDPYLRYVHPELRQIAGAILQMAASEKPLGLGSLAEARGGMSKFARQRRNDVSAARQTIAGLRNQPDVQIFVINSKPGTKRPAILHTHGGGFVMGSAALGLADLQDLCEQLDCVAVTVDYRLAPETTWRGSLEDNYAGLKWLYANAASIGADPARIAVMGESAGGGHAALLAIAARDRGEIPLVFQCLTYPMLDDRTGSSRNVPEYMGKIIWNSQKNRFGWQSFLGVTPGTRQVPRQAVPSRTENLVGLPPAFIGVGTIDLFFDEDVEFVRRLNDAGVPAEMIVVPGAFHAFDIIGLTDPTIRISRWFNEARLTALKRGLSAT